VGAVIRVAGGVAVGVDLGGVVGVVGAATGVAGGAVIGVASGAVIGVVGGVASLSRVILS